MTKRSLAVLAMLAASMAATSAARAHGWNAGHGGHEAIEEHHQTGPYRSPGLAAALSLTPMPVDFGNLYADNVGWGIAYTSVELGLLVPMFWIARDHGMGHGDYGSTNPWTSTDRNWMIGLASGYLAVKLISGLHAAHAADDFNQRQHGPRLSGAVVPTSEGAAALAALQF